MKALSVFLLLALAVPTLAQEAAEPAAPTRELTAAEQEFFNLPEEKCAEFAKHLGEAYRLFQQKRIFETMEEITKANKIFDRSPDCYNLEGSCYVEMRAFDKALAAFLKAKELAPPNPSIEFNIAEVHFVTQKWQEAHDLFFEVLKMLPPENLALGRLVEFKLLLCKKKLGMKDEAVALAEKYDYQDDSPYYYYAQAAIAYDDGNLVKAEEWLAMANRIFRDPAILAPWQDTLVEFGYIKSFYGEDNAEQQ